MKTMINLTKIYFKESIVGFLGKTKKSQTRQSLLLFSLLLIIGVSLGFNYYAMAEAFSLVGLAQTILPLGILTSAIILILTNTKGFGGGFYQAKDYEMLSALPIKSSSVIAARFVSSLLVSMVFCFATLAPVFVVYFIFNGIAFLPVLFCLISIVFMPMFSQFLGSAISWISNILASKFKNRNLISGVFSLIFVIAAVAVVSMMSSEFMARIFAEDFPLWMKIVMPFVWLLTEAISKSSVLYFLAFVGVCLLYAVASVALISVGFKKINQGFKVSAGKKLGKLLAYEKRSVLGWLIKKDAKKFFSTPIYFVNVIAGPVFALIVPFALAGMAGDLAMLGQDIMVIIAATVAPMMLGMAPFCATAISVEGASFKMIKSFPISHKSFLWAKIAFNFLLNLPFLLISQVLTIIILKIQLVSAILIMVFGLLFLYFISLSSLFINLLLPRLEWTSIAHVVKQSASVLICMLINMALALAVIIVPIAILPQTISANLYLLIVVFAMILLNVMLTILFETKSKRLYLKLS